ncbi:hypothetical protein BDA99DRAFT_498135 [Phascolomyces articulosus]|uniref:C2H2-type domain-containing protein n=1 Tax=Phascolomyces articulosus TaxID=60185 RepID=A0AAD5KS16_9FUNG|nr:hypothetical protein BDA99DRAFT_498135 [Phascolomyces articulosus]
MVPQSATVKEKTCIKSNQDTISKKRKRQELGSEEEEIQTRSGGVGHHPDNFITKEPKGKRYYCPYQGCKNSVLIRSGLYGHIRKRHYSGFSVLQGTLKYVL